MLYIIAIVLLDAFLILYNCFNHVYSIVRFRITQCNQFLICQQWYPFNNGIIYQNQIWIGLNLKLPTSDRFQYDWFYIYCDSWASCLEITLVVKTVNWSPGGFKANWSNRCVMNITIHYHTAYRADSRLATSQWEMLLQSNAFSHWLAKNLESALCIYHMIFNEISSRFACEWENMTYSNKMPG